jgi:adenine/guanine/hypoxanthine permease
MKKILSNIANRYEFSSYGTNWRTEILAGVSTYLSLAYIFVLNPAIMSDGTGMSVSAIFFATIIASGISTLAMGLWARLPFALAPGLEMNGFFAYIVVGTFGYTWHQALGAVFWSGLLCILFTVLPIRQKIVDSIPLGLKKAMAISVGAFVFAIGLSLAGIVTFKDGIITNTNFHLTPQVIALLIGLVISYVLGLRKLKFVAGMLVAIIIATVYCKTQGIVSNNPAKLNSDLFLAVGKVDLFPPNFWQFIPVILIFFLIDFYGSIGKFIGLTAATNLTKADGTLPRIKDAMNVDGGGTILGSLLGTSSIITYVESAVGIATGGRTGIVAIVCGLLMLLSFLITPLVGLVPVVATSGILCYVGWLLVRDTWEEKQLKTSDWVISVAMACLSLFRFNLGEAMALGFVIYTILHLVKEKGKYNWYLIVSAILIVGSVVAQQMIKRKPKEAPKEKLQAIYKA